LVFGATAITFGITRWVTIRQFALPEGEGGTRGFTSFQHMFISVAVGVIAICASAYFFGRAKKM
jgi:hypothetical protein